MLLDISFVKGTSRKLQVITKYHFHLFLSFLTLVIGMVALCQKKTVQLC